MPVRVGPAPYAARVTLCIVDCETTGVDPSRHHVWEIGVIVRSDADVNATDTEYCWQIRPDLTTADPFALRIGGYHQRCQVKAAPIGTVHTLTYPTTDPAAPATAAPPGPPRAAAAGSEAGTAGQLAGQLAELLDGATLVAVNVAFDRDFLAAFLRRAGECLTADYHLVDVCALSAGWLHGRGRAVPGRWRADELALAVGIDPAGYERHTALADARFARDVYDAVTAVTA